MLSFAVERVKQKCLLVYYLFILVVAVTVHVLHLISCSVITTTDWNLCFMSTLQMFDKKGILVM